VLGETLAYTGSAKQIRSARMLILHFLGNYEDANHVGRFCRSILTPATMMLASLHYVVDLHLAAIILVGYDSMQRINIRPRTGSIGIQMLFVSLGLIDLINDVQVDASLEQPQSSVLHQVYSPPPHSL
jgi:hypothetical protein